MYSAQLDIFRSMLRIRRVEEALAERYAQQQMRCPMHLCIGQEATAAGICHALEQSDHVFGNHRAHGHYLAKGGDLKRMVAELYGRATGCCAGRGGSMHLIDQNAGFMGATPIVGGTVPLAVGAAWAAQLQGARGAMRVTVVFFGDGCFEEGVMHEALNFAALKKLPLLFVCENNAYSVYTHLRERQPPRTLHIVAQAHGVSACSADGNDAVAVHELGCEAVAQARAGSGPQFLELYTQRWSEHCGPGIDNKPNDRRSGGLESNQQHCPIERSRSFLKNLGLLPDVLEQRMEDEIRKELVAAFAFALSSPLPEAQPQQEVARVG